MMKLWFDEFGMNSWLIVVDDVVKTCCWWIGVMIMPYGELMMKVVVVVE